MANLTDSRESVAVLYQKKLLRKSMAEKRKRITDS